MNIFSLIMCCVAARHLSLVFFKCVWPQQMNKGHNLSLICRHNHQHNLSTGLTAEEVAKLPPRRHRNVKTVGHSKYAGPACLLIHTYLSSVGLRTYTQFLNNNITSENG